MTSRLLVAGMPGSGKSTFIAALKHVLVAEAVHASLRITRFADHEEHLNALEDRWLSLDRFDRTKTSTEAWVELHVRRVDDGTEAVLVIPDLRGEAFEQPACQGLCRSDVHEVLAASDGILVFTSADRPDDDLLMSDLDDAFGAGAEEVLPEDEAADTAPPKVEPVDARGRRAAHLVPDLIGEEAKLVELLQVPNRRPLVATRRRLALIVSAWDLVGRDGAEAPTDWVRANRPMLAQFLRHNGDLWRVRIYGVSAQGGRLPEDKGRLEAVLTPSERVLIVGEACARHDVAAPIVWLTSPGPA